MEVVTLKAKEYGESHKDHILQIYMKYIDTIDRVSDRRQNANNFFLSINTALVAFIGFTGFGNAQVKININFMLAIVIAGILLAFLWFRTIKSYRDLNNGKFKVLHEIEKCLPLAPFSIEWKMIGSGRDRRLYWPFSHVERYVPILFMLIYISLIAFSLLTK